MKLEFLTPLAAFVALAALFPLAVFVAQERRARRLRQALALRPAPRQVAVAASVAAVGVLLALAATQPVIETKRTRPERTDAEVYLLIDASRSMLAGKSADSPTRFDRARDAALELRRSLPKVPIGLASFTDRALPNVLPTTDPRVLETALRKSMGVDLPPPAQFYAGHATTFSVLSQVPRTNFFSPSVRKRVLVVFTDGEAREKPSPTLARAFDRTPRIQTLFVRHWAADERIYVTGIAEVGYRPDEARAAALTETASLVRGRVFDESELGAVRDELKRLLGDGPTREQEREGERFALMPFATLAAVVPLAFVLRRRNL